MKYPRIILAGTNSGVGKTTLSLGIMLVLRKQGLNVQPFKVGPDYIDPTYHAQVTGKTSHNLDSWLLSQDVIPELFKRQAKKADISIIEGVMGLYDGLKDSEEGSTAHLAKMLTCPVILILDARSLSRSAAAIALGYREFDKKVNIAGIVLNNIGSDNHYAYVKSSIEKKTKIPVLGYLPKSPDLKLPERHLGLVPTEEKKLHRDFYRRLSNLVEENIDIGEILKISRQAQALPGKKRQIFLPGFIKERVTVAVARDKAFSFYYQDNLDILNHLGARIIEFSPLRDKKLPEDIDGLYIGGGFPELFASRLSRNVKLKKEIHQRAEDGLPIYAECGGLMYLVERLIDFEKKTFPMTGIFKGSVSMTGRLQALGYVNAETITDNILSKKGAKIRAHIFHWSYLDDIPKNMRFAYRIKKSKDKIFYDGLVEGNVLAGYMHLHFASDINFAKNFIKSCQEHRIDNG